MQLWHILRLWIFNEAPTEPRGKRVTSHSPASFEFTPSLLELTAEPRLFECHDLHYHKWWAAHPAGINNHVLQHLSTMREAPLCSTVLEVLPYLWTLGKRAEICKQWREHGEERTAIQRKGWHQRSLPALLLLLYRLASGMIRDVLGGSSSCLILLRCLFQQMSSNLEPQWGGGSGTSDRGWKQLMELNETSENGR